MIKIEFKEVNESMGNEFRFSFTKDVNILHDIRVLKQMNSGCSYRAVLPYSPIQDPYLDRLFILQQLGISKEQDEEMQLKYSK